MESMPPVVLSHPTYRKARTFGILNKNQVLLKYNIPIGWGNFGTDWGF